MLRRKSKGGGLSPKKQILSNLVNKFPETQTTLRSLSLRVVYSVAVALWVLYTYTTSS